MIRINAKRLLKLFSLRRGKHNVDERNWPRAQPFTVYATRDDVHAGDTAEPLRFVSKAGSDAASVLQQATDPGWLPYLYESIVNWSIMSNGLIAMIEHDCRGGATPIKITALPGLNERMRGANWSDGELKLHFTYDAPGDFVSSP